MTSELEHLAPDVETLAQRLASVDYLVDEGLATALFLSLRLPQPLLLEGEAGVGKTEAAKALAAVLDTPLIRLQCYDGIDASEALYEWNYPRQLLSIRLAEAQDTALTEDALFGPEYLVARPLLRALQHPGPRPAVLLIDEIDRADDDFEAFLLELLAEAAVTIPELGTIKATHPPAIVLTSNRTRDLHDAVKRRCLYQWIDYPDARREVEIVRRRVKGASESLAVQVVTAVAKMRDGDIQKPPGIAEAIDWLKALELLGRDVAGRGDDRAHAGQRPEVRRGPGRRPRRGPGELGVRLETVELDLPPLVAAFGRRLHEAGVPVTAERSARLASALTLTRPVSRTRLYWTARAVMVQRRGAGEGVRSGLLHGVRVARGSPGGAGRAARRARGDDAPGAAVAPGGGEPPAAADGAAGHRGPRGRARRAAAPAAAAPATRRPATPLTPSCPSRRATRSGCARSASTRSSRASSRSSTC